MIELSPAQYERVHPLFLGMDYHLVGRSILNLLTPARIFVDNEQQPQALFAQAGHRFILAGDSTLRDFNLDLQREFAERIFPQGLEGGDEAFSLYYDHPAWEASMDGILPEKYPLRTAREYYACKALKDNWRERLPADFRLQMVDAELLANDQLESVDNLREETTSERPSVEDFLAKSFGTCALHENALAGWCLSEYNTDGRCEIGIETVTPFRKRGLATALTLALVEHAFANGYTEVGWHCLKRNAASGNTALKAGFDKVCDYPAFIVWYNAADGLTVHGNEQLRQNDFQAALDFYEKAIRRAVVNGWTKWTFWGAARAASMLGNTADAMHYLNQAMEQGWDDLEAIRASEHLANLRASPEWEKRDKSIE
jgi:RimJ/RimL family protein N-acetyltransferase